MSFQKESSCLGLLQTCCRAQGAEFFTALFGSERFEHLVGELMIAAAARVGGDLGAAQLRKLQVLMRPVIACGVLLHLQRDQQLQQSEQRSEWSIKQDLTCLRLCGLPGVCAGAQNGCITRHALV